MRMQKNEELASICNIDDRDVSKRLLFSVTGQILTASRETFCGDYKIIKKAGRVESWNDGILGHKIFSNLLNSFFPQMT